MRAILVVLLSAVAVVASAAEVKTGGSKMIEVDGKYHVWTDRVGTGPAKMLTLHGGPGFPHDYLECFEDFVLATGFESEFDHEFHLRLALEGTGCCSPFCGHVISKSKSVEGRNRTGKKLTGATGG